MFELEYAEESLIPAEAKDLYVNHGGKFVHKGVVGLVQNKDQILAERKQFAEKLKAFEGVDPERYQTLIKAHEEAETKRQLEAGNFKALEQQLIEKHQTELQKKQAREEFLFKQVESHLIDAVLTQEIVAQKGSPKLLLPHLKTRAKVFEEDGGFVAKVIDDKGNPQIGDSKGTPKTFAQLVDEFKNNPEFQRAFEPSGAAGSGAPSTQSSRGASSIRITSAEAKDHNKYMAAKEQARKLGVSVEIV